jgi:hypothetical protein
LSFQSLPGKNFAYLDTRLSFGSKPWGKR